MTTETTPTPAPKTLPKPATKGGPGKPDLYDPWDLHVVGLDDECGEEAAFYDPRVKDPVAESFIDSIAADGVMEPVECRATNDFRIVFGRKRVMAARIAALPVAEGGREKRVLVPVIFTPAGLKRAEAEARVLIENVQRIDDNALVVADKAAAFLARNGDTPENRLMLQRALGVKANKLHRLLRLREGDPALARAIASGELSVTAALRITVLPVDQQATVVRKVIAAAKAHLAPVVKAPKVAKEPKEPKKAKRGAQDDEQTEVVDAPAKPAKVKKVSNREVHAAVQAAKGTGTGFARPTTTSVREVLEVLRENPFLDDNVTADSILTWVVGDGPCPFDLTLVADMANDSEAT